MQKQALTVLRIIQQTELLLTEKGCPRALPFPFPEALLCISVTETTHSSLTERIIADEQKRS
jgi:hypothetical protein